MRVRFRLGEWLRPASKIVNPWCFCQRIVIIQEKSLEHCFFLGFEGNKAEDLCKNDLLPWVTSVPSCIFSPFRGLILHQECPAGRWSPVAIASWRAFGGCWDMLGAGETRREIGQFSKDVECNSRKVWMGLKWRLGWKEWNNHFFVGYFCWRMEYFPYIFSMGTVTSSGCFFNLWRSKWHCGNYWDSRMAEFVVQPEVRSCIAKRSAVEERWQAAHFLFGWYLPSFWCESLRWMRFWHRHLPAELCICHKKSLVLPWRLPLQRNLRLAVLGPLRNATEELLGNYQAWPMVVPACSPAAPSSRLGLYMWFHPWRAWRRCQSGWKGPQTLEQHFMVLGFRMVLVESLSRNLKLISDCIFACDWGFGLHTLNLLIFESSGSYGLDSWWWDGAMWTYARVGSSGRWMVEHGDSVL